MAKLHELAKVIRSKNAGALLLTLDIMFDNEEAYRTVFDSGVLSPRKIASLYNLSDNQVEIIAFEVALAIKITIPRHTTAGSPGDSDVYGAQQHAPLLDLEITSYILDVASSNHSLASSNEFKSVSLYLNENHLFADDVSIPCKEAASNSDA